MELTDRKIILKYLNITLLSYSRICYFIPGKDRKARVKARFMKITNDNVVVFFDDKPPKSDGYFVFHSYTYMLRFSAKLSSGNQPGVYYCSIPELLESHDQRRYARLIFESKENKIVSVYNNDLKQSIRVILADISAGGIRIICVDTDDIPKVGDLLLVDLVLMKRQVKSFARVMQVRGDQVGCSFMDKSNEFQIELNKLITTEIQWRSEIMLRNLKRRDELMKKVREVKVQEEPESQGADIDLDVLDPIVEFFVARFESLTGVLLERKELVFKEETTANFAASLYFNLHFGEAKFKCFFYAHSSVIYKMARLFFKDRQSGVVVNLKSILSALGNKLLKRSAAQASGNTSCEIDSPGVVEANKRLLTSLSRNASIVAPFSCELGDFTLMLMADDLAEALSLCKKSNRVFITMDKMDLIEPLSYATLDVFANYLKLEIKEKSIITRDRLLPRFEITILLDIFFEDSEGKVVLNMSKKLALKIFEILVHEKVDEFNEEVKDAVAEVTNMITGNAKSEYEKRDVYYKLSTPLVLDCKDKAIIYSKNMTFLSSVYWTSEGFFELSFSVYKK